MLNNLKNIKIKKFLIIWVIITALISLIAAGALLGVFDSPIINAKVDEISANPQLASAIQQWKRQGISESQIQKQVEKIAYEQAGAGAAISVMKKSAFRAAAIAVILLVVFYFIFSKNKISNQQKLLFAIVILGLLLIDQVYIAQKYVMKEPVNMTLQKPEAIAELQKYKQPFRVAVLDKNVYNLWVASLFKLNGIECIDVPADSRPTPLRKLFFYTNKISPVRRWEYSNVEYILGPQRGVEMYLRQLGARKDFSVVYTFLIGNQKHAIFKFKKTLPRVYAVGEWTVITNAEKAIAFMNNPRTDPRKIAVLTQNGVDEKDDTNFVAEVKILNYKPTKINTEVELSNTGLVAMATETDGNWKILIDGQPAKIIRCNLLHFGAFVPAGKHTVSFYYDKKPTTIVKVTRTAYLLLPVLLLITIIISLLASRSKQ